MKAAALKRVVADVDNPYSYFQHLLVSSGAPPFTKGLEARIAVLLTLLSYLVLISVLLIGVTAYKPRREGHLIWLVRLVRRPQGRYLSINQAFVAPISFLVTAIVWIFYIDAIGVWWRTGILSRHIVFWIVFNSSLPLATGWLITFACLSGANLISSRKNEASRHIVGPKTMNSTIGFLFPLSVAGILVTSIRAGQAYERLDNLVLILYKQAAKDSAAYDGSMTALQVEGTKKALAALARTTLVIPFADLTAEYRNWSIVYLVSLSILFTVNVVGGALLLSSLRVMDNSPRTSFTAPLVTRQPAMTLADTLVIEGLAPSKWDEELDEDKMDRADFKGRPLEFETTVFYFSIGPACLVLMGYAAWIAVSSTKVFHVEPQLELASLGLEWMGTAIGCVGLTIMLVKRIRQVLQPVQTLRDPYPIPTLSRKPSSDRRQPSPSLQSTPGDDMAPIGGFERFSQSTFEDLSYRKSEEDSKSLSSNL